LTAPVADDIVDAYVAAAAEYDVLIAEVRAFGNNPLASDPVEAKASLERCRQQLALADRAGARCCVNIAGSIGPDPHGPFAADLEEDTFALVVDSVREIIDGVRPARTFYALETMPWMLPDSSESYERLVRAVDREWFGVHFDPVNLVWSPRLYFQTSALIRDFVGRLGGRIRSCHAKDIRLRPDLTVHLDEVRPGAGALDYRTLVSELHLLDPEMPLMIEHLSSAEECALAASYISSVCRSAGVAVVSPPQPASSRRSAST
jgi:sugar phosphate isomerase/epimerase